MTEKYSNVSWYKEHFTGFQNWNPTEDPGIWGMSEVNMRGNRIVPSLHGTVSNIVNIVIKHKTQNRARIVSSLLTEVSVVPSPTAVQYKINTDRPTLIIN